MQVRKASAKVVYESTDITTDLLPNLKSLSYTDELSGKADDLQIVVEDRQGRWLDAWFPDKGASLTVSLTTQGWGAVKELALGVFEIDEISASGWPSEISIKAVSIPCKSTLRDETHSKSWENVTFKRIAQDIADDAELTLQYDIEENPEIERAEQTDEADLTFLMELCNQHGFALKVYKEQLVIFDESIYEQKDAVATIVKPGAVYTEDSGTTYITGILNYSFSSKVRDIYNACHVKYYDSQTGKTYESTYTDESKESGKILQVNEQVNSTAEAEELAKKRLREKNKEEVTGNISMPGNLSLVAAVCVTLLGFGKFDGKYIITRASHELGGGYTTSIDLRRCLDEY